MIQLNPEDIFQRMANVRKFHFKSISHENSKMNWDYTGEGIVEVKTEDNHIYYTEKVLLKDEKEFLSQRLWVFNDRKIELLRLTQGEYEKIFDYCIKDNKLIISDEFICSLDTYKSEVIFYDTYFLLLFRSTGPKKDEEIIYQYIG